MTAKKLALDFATRNLIAETVHDAITAELHHAAMRADVTPVAQLHGPSSYPCEGLIVGAVLIGALDIRAVPLNRSDFWAQLTGRIWSALQVSYDPRLIPVVIDNAFALGLLDGEPEHYEVILEQWADIASDLTAKRDLDGAIALIREHSRARRLVAELSRLADGICAGHESFDSAKLALRELFTDDARAKKNLMSDTSAPLS